MNGQTVNVLILSILFLSATAGSRPIYVENHSFEIPEIDPEEIDPPALPYAAFWIELDVDTDPRFGGRNTGVFHNTEPNSPAGDYIINVDGNQLAFLGGQTGNAFLQELTAAYQVGKRYRLQVDVCPSKEYPPKTTIPMDTLVLALYDPNSADPNDLVTSVVYATDLVANKLRTFSVHLPPVKPDDSWAGETIGIAFRAVGTANQGVGPFWDLDNVRLTEYLFVPDFNDDSLVNLIDFSRISAEWLSCTNTTADLTGDGCVDIEDLIEFAEFWLDNN